MELGRELQLRGWLRRCNLPSAIRDPLTVVSSNLHAHLRLPQTPLPPAPLDSSQRLFRNTLDKIVSMRKFSLIESAFSVYEIGQAASSSSLNTFGEPKCYRLSNLETQCNARGDEYEFLARPVYDWLLLLLPNSSCFTMATGVSPSLS